MSAMPLVPEKTNVSHLNAQLPWSIPWETTSPKPSPRPWVTNVAGKS
ncbi:hypothetical protein SAZ11_00615 [Streptomyces sp. FXJ1.4098]|nr:hypothetical protein [Streptomyces sp. FXJ1.4098]